MVKVINHGVSGKLMEDMIKATQSFFHLTEEEKREYTGEDLFSPITNGKAQHRNYLRAFVHPDFHFPSKPPGLRYFTSFNTIQDVIIITRHNITMGSLIKKINNKDNEMMGRYQNLGNYAYDQ